MFDEWAYKNNLLNTIAGIKYFNVYGPGEAHKNDMRSMVHKAYEQIINTGRVKLFKSYRPEFKDGEQVRDFLFVDDAVRLTLWFGENIDKNGIFNCGTSCLRTWIDLVNSVFSAMNKSPEIDFIEMPDYLKDKYQYKTCADLSRLREIGYNCQFTSLEKGVEITVKSLLNRV
jgi:ADP-L-glycero-D-manno-heptose 6-epimerase